MGWSHYWRRKGWKNEATDFFLTGRTINRAKDGKSDETFFLVVIPLALRSGGGSLLLNLRLAE